MVPRGARRALTAEGFGKFLRWLSENDELAVREYQSIRMKLVRYFIHKGCSDPDDLFDKTVDVVVGKIDTCGECPSPLAYCYGVAKNIWRQDLRERKSATLQGTWLYQSNQTRRFMSGSCKVWNTAWNKWSRAIAIS